MSKPSSLKRALELAKLAAKVGLKEIKSGDFQSRYDQALLIAKSLSQLKGAAMKVGQLLSLDLDNYFPPEAIEVLSQLQNAAIAHPFEDIEKIIKSEIPPETFKNISSISQSPIGVASIGQVHRARYADKDIVLKVQYANVAHSVEADLKILKTLALSFCQVTGRKMNLDPLFQEFRSILEQELDFSAEANFQRRFQAKIEKLKRRGDWEYKVPQVVDEISSKRLLGMSFERGVTLRNWLATNPNQRDRQQLAIAVLDLYFHEFFEWGLVQTDPNWGNFLVDQSSAQPTLCLLDFGATRSYSREFIRNYIALLEAASSNDFKKLKELAIEFQLIDAREAEPAFIAFERMLKTAIKPFFAKEKGATHFDFADRNHALESQAAAKELSQELIYSPPPYSIVFLHRKLAGVYAILKSLEVRLDISPYWELMNDYSSRSE